METEKQKLDDDSTDYWPRHARPRSFKVIHHCDCAAAALTFLVQKYRTYTRGRQRGGMWMPSPNSRKRELLSTELVQHPRKFERATQKGKRKRIK
jgi:hypothetical protein